MALFESVGRTVVRSAASAGPLDLVSWNSEDVFFTQVKRATSTATYASAKSKAKKGFMETIFPESVIVECWIYHEHGWRVLEWIEGEFISKPTPGWAQHGR